MVSRVMAGMVANTGVRLMHTSSPQGSGNKFEKISQLMQNVTQNSQGKYERFKQSNTYGAARLIGVFGFEIVKRTAVLFGVVFVGTAVFPKQMEKMVKWIESFPRPDGHA